MEKPAKKLLLRHFSHEHLLEHTRESLPKGSSSICFGCKLDFFPGKHYYRCKTCPFYLHQVCYSMPQKVQHQVDPKHNLILLSMPPSNIVDNSIECKACQKNINNGFYYNCGRCGNFFHALCLAAPLSVKLPVHVHPHTLTLEFSPPYDFQCDLCDEPSYHGWLYRCGLCEFDAHISCALMDKQAMKQMLPETELSSPIFDDADRRKDNELMELLSRGMKAHEENRSTESFQNQKESQDDQAIIQLSEDKTTPSYQCTPSYHSSDACFSIDLAKSFLNDDDHRHQEKGSEEDKTTPSYQCTPSYHSSDACFSIDLAKSFINDDDHLHQEKGSEEDVQQFQVLGSNKEPRPIGFVVVPKGLVGDAMQVNPTFDVSRSPSLDFCSNKSAKRDQNLAILDVAGSNFLVEIGQGNSRNTLLKKSSNDEAAAAASKLTKKSESGTVRSRCSCW